MKEKTKNNIYTAFVGEAKAYFRLLAYAEKAREEDVPQIAMLFRAIAEAERIHATRCLGLLKEMMVKDTDTNLAKSFKSEQTVSENAYPEFLKVAEEEGENGAATVFSHARDAETFHAKLYERAIYQVIRDEVSEYQVCQVCGYVTSKNAPDTCPVCGAPKDKFKSVN